MCSGLLASSILSLLDRIAILSNINMHMIKTYFKTIMNVSTGSCPVHLQRVSLSRCNCLLAASSGNIAFCVSSHTLCAVAPDTKTCSFSSKAKKTLQWLWSGKYPSHTSCGRRCSQFTPCDRHPVVGSRDGYGSSPVSRPFVVDSLQLQLLHSGHRRYGIQRQRLAMYSTCH